LEKVQEDAKKIKSKDVFEGYKAPKSKSKGSKSKGKVPKGYHRMPDGSIMKDSDMKKGKSKKSKY
jgi:hypothetical protein